MNNSDCKLCIFVMRVPNFVWAIFGDRDWPLATLNPAHTSNKNQSTKSQKQTGSYNRRLLLLSDT